MATCAVSGTIKDISETAISGATIKANLTTPIFSGTSYLAPKEISTTSDTSGNWTLNLSQGSNVIITIESVQNSTDGARRTSYACIIPSTSTANFSTLAVEL